MVSQKAITRKFSPLILCIALVVILGSLLLVGGLLAPIRVIGGSMAETFYGPHYKICCHDCRYCFSIDALAIPPPQSIHCPNCGHRSTREVEQPIHPGDQLLVNKVSYHFRDPKRWEPVLFRSTQPSVEYCLKRVVGLPKENVVISQGDLWVNGQRLKKDWPTLMSMALVVHDSRFASTSPRAVQRWRSLKAESGWERVGNGYRCSPDAQTSPRQQFDIIGYQHLDFRRGDPQATDKITDDYAYNQTLSRRLYPTDDLVLSAKIQCQGSGSLSFQLGNCRLQLDCDQQLGALFYAGRQIASFPWDVRQLQQPTQLEVATVDRQFFLVIDNKVCFSRDLEAGSEASPSAVADRTAEWPEHVPRLAIGSKGLAIRVADLRVLRDVYYTREITGVIESRTEECSLGEDEFFVLGDNSPVSLDSRRDAAAALVRRQDLCGRVWRWR